MKTQKLKAEREKKIDYAIINQQEGHIAML